MLVNKTDSCWLWVGYIDRYGYGTRYFEGRTQGVHRIAYQLLIGPVPAGLQLDHLCRVKNCVNVEHLEPVTGAVNTRRARLIKTRCPAGHAYDYVVSTTGERRCRACTAEQKRKYRDRARGGPAKPYGSAKTHCDQGHPYDGANTGHKANGARRCRACAREYSSRRRQEKAA